MIIGSTLQIDLQGNSSTATVDRIAGFGGAPNMGSDPHGRRHSSFAYNKAGKEAVDGKVIKGRKLVVQLVETYREHMHPVFVEELDAWQLQDKMGSDFPPIMIYGEDVTHIVTEEGIANLLLCRSAEEREQAIRGVAGYTPIGMQRDHAKVEELRQRGIIQRPEDLGIDTSKATRDLLAAQSVKDLVKWSEGLYSPPSRFRNW